MNDKKFDEIFASKINAHESPVPPDMFERIRGEDKKRGYFMWWWIGAGIAAVVAGIILFTAWPADQPKPDVITENKTINEGNDSRTEVVPKSAPNPNNKTKSNRENDNQRIADVTQNGDRTVPKSNQAGVTREHVPEPSLKMISEDQKKPDLMEDHEQPDLILTAGRDDRYLRFDRNKKLPGYAALALGDTTITLKKRKQRSNKFFVEGHAGPAAAIRRVEELVFYPLTGPGDETKLAWHAGVMIGKKLGSKWSIKTGLYYTSIAWSDARSARNDSSTYGARMFDVPVIAGYQVNDGKLSININGGVMANIYTTYQGYTSDSLSQSYTLQKSGYLKKNVGWKAYAGVSAMYAVNNSLAILIEPSFIYHLNDMSRNEKLFRVKTHQAGIAAGVRYYFQ